MRNRTYTLWEKLTIAWPRRRRINEERAIMRQRLRVLTRVCPGFMESFPPYKTGSFFAVAGMNGFGFKYPESYQGPIKDVRSAYIVSRQMAYELERKEKRETGLGIYWAVYDQSKCPNEVAKIIVESTRKYRLNHSYPNLSGYGSNKYGGW